MSGACNDCGAAFKGEVKDHYDAAHPGMDRFRFRGTDGVSHLICAKCGFDRVEGAHLEKTAYVTGKSVDPADYFQLHLQSHGGDL